MSISTVCTLRGGCPHVPSFRSWPGLGEAALPRMSRGASRSIVDRGQGWQPDQPGCNRSGQGRTPNPPGACCKSVNCGVKGQSAHRFDPTMRCCALRRPDFCHFEGFRLPIRWISRAVGLWQRVPRRWSSPSKCSNTLSRGTVGAASGASAAAMEGCSTRAYARWKTGTAHGPSAVKNQGDDSFSGSDTPSRH